MPCRATPMLFCLAGMICVATAHAGESNRVTASELRQLVLGSTITGRYNNGEPYSEYHAPDGRVFGHNNHQLNEEACWDIKADTICYYYAKGRAKGEFCWAFEKLGSQGIRATLLKDTGLREIIGIVQTGNPHGHSDNGKPWSCDALTSQNMDPRDAFPRHAAR